MTTTATAAKMPWTLWDFFAAGILLGMAAAAVGMGWAILGPDILGLL